MTMIRSEKIVLILISALHLVKCLYRTRSPDPFSELEDIPVHAEPPTCPVEPQTLYLSSPPDQNYFYSDCKSTGQVVVTSTLLGNDFN